MYKKQCPSCQQLAFGNKSEGIWICPVCQADITEIPAQEATTNKNMIHLFNELVKKMG
jgi:ribosomal protein L37AE/L43A